MDRSKYHNVHVSIIPIVVSKTFLADCNTLTFLNQGTQNVTINGQLLLTPGTGYQFDLYPGEMLTQAFDIVFPNDRAAGCNLVAITKEYHS